jgi:predicted ATPase/DNA-binding SARP family transcriptional activator
VTNGIWRFGVLGPLMIERDGQPVPLASGRQRALLALLLKGAGVPLSRDRLINELWGEHPPSTAVSAIHVHLSKLRALLDGLLVLEPAGYLLAPDGFELDTQRLDSILERARSTPEQAAPLLHEALGLFRGEPLCDAMTDGTLTHWARSLQEKRLQASMTSIDIELEAGRAADVLVLLEELVNEHPFEERVWGQLILALYRSGRQAEALAAYQRARHRFVVELGLEPGEPLAQLQRRVLERDPALLVPAPASSAPARPAARGAPFDVPHPATRLVGRAREMTALSGLLTDPDIRMITLRGPGGVGKTRLLLELARESAANYVDGAVFVRLEHVSEPNRVYAEIAAALAHRDGTDGPSADGLEAYLRDRELLLAIDNFEQLLTAGPAVADLLAGAPRTRAIVTSRAALRIRGEQTFDVEPLGLPVDGSNEQAAQSPAVELFLQCALAANRSLTVDVTTTLIAAEICQALDGLPLAIELAASRSHALTPTQIAGQLAQPLSIGGPSLRDLPDRQRTLDATIRWSYDMLPARTREVLRCASVFLGGFTEASLEAVTGRPVRSHLEELLEASLVQRQHDDTRYALLELVRAFASNELDLGGTSAEALARHGAYFAAHVASANQAFNAGVAPGEIAAPLLVDHANLLAAFDHAIEARDEAAAVPIALGLRPLWLAGMLRQESQDVVDRLLARFPVSGTVEVALLRAVAFLDYGPSANIRHRQLANRALEIGDLDVVTTATGNIFGHALNTRNREEMRRLRSELTALITPETSTGAGGWIHYYLALDAYVNGDLDSACSHAGLSVEAAVEIGHEFMHAGSIGARLLSESARDGQIQHGALTEAIDVMRRPSVQPLAAFALWLLARFAVDSTPELAGQWLVHAERIVTELDSELWPECELRDETMAILGITDLESLLANTLPRHHAIVLEEGAAWLAQRDREETARRAIVRLPMHRGMHHTSIPDIPDTTDARR